MTPAERIDAVFDAMRVALKRHREVLRLERAIGSTEDEACANASTAYMLAIAEQESDQDAR